MNAPKYEFFSYLAVLECQTVQPTSDSLSSTQARLALRSQTPKGNLTAIAWTWGVTNPAVPGRAAQNGIRPVPLRGPYRIRAKCLFSQLTRLGLTSTIRVFPDPSPIQITCNRHAKNATHGKEARLTFWTISQFKIHWRGSHVAFAVVLSATTFSGYNPPSL